MTPIQFSCRVRMGCVWTAVALGIAVGSGWGAFARGLADAAPPPSRHGTTLYVSKLGDHSDGTSWTKAFRTIQAALDAVPDDRGGHRVIIRPDTYPEANLYPTHGRRDRRAEAEAPPAVQLVELCSHGLIL